MKLSETLQKPLLRIPASYQSSFNWSVYDDLERRFGNQQPRGGVVFKTTFKLVNYHPSCTRCHYSFELDTYGRGCLHNCQYCYAKEQLTQHGFWNRPFPFPVDIAKVIAIMATVFDTDRPSKWRSILEKRIPLRIGSMSDAFLYMDRKYGVTAELLRVLKHYRYPYIIFTRSDLVAEKPYLDLLDPELAVVQMSLSGDNATLTQQLEPGAPSPQKRFEALKRLNERGIRTAIRINPLFP
ncbi:MAG: hypothetical protein NZ480_07295, partial [Bdellovibrionaceae bacterium]|nr:hypothetical protein [Pseudobdellovibrionaceae bacterium]